MVDINFAFHFSLSLACTMFGFTNARKVMESVNEFKQLKSQREQLNNIQEQTVEEATEELTRRKKPDSDSVEMMALIKGTTLRGITLASNIIKNQTRTPLTKAETLDQSAKNMKDDTQPLFLKNYFKS